MQIPNLLRFAINFPLLLLVTSCGNGLSFNSGSLTVSLTLENEFFTKDGNRIVASGRAIPFYQEVNVKVSNLSGAAVTDLSVSGTSRIVVESSPDCLASLAAGSDCELKVGVLANSMQELSETIEVKRDSEILGTFTVASENSKVPSVWLDPSDLSTLFTDSSCTVAAQLGDTIGCIKDKSGNTAMNFIQASAASRPLLQASTGFASRNILLWDGANDTMTAAGTNLRSTLGKAHSFGAFHRSTTGSGHAWQRFFSACLWSESSNDLNAPCYGMIAAVNPGTGSPDVRERYLVENRMDTDSVNLKVLALGYNTRWGTEFMEGESGEFLLYETSLTAGESRTGVRQYYQHRWGTQNTLSFPD